jgi:hypothetical protein
MEKKLYISPMVTVLKLSTEVGFLAGSGTEPGANINPREGEGNDPMAKPMPDFFEDVEWGF